MLPIDASMRTPPDSDPSAGADPARDREPKWRLLTFVALQLAVVAAGATWAVLRVRALEAERAMPAFRERPLEVHPQYDRPDVISDADLQKVLYHLRPRLRGPRPRINHVDHALRFWGVQAKFRDRACLSGQEMRQILTDHRLFARRWGKQTPSLLVDTLRGVRARVQEGGNTSSHVDHTLASLAEVGTPLDFPLHTPQGETTFREMLDYAVRNFSLNQVEYEWSATVFALYMPTDREWRTTEGQWISFDKLAERIMRQRLIQGVCFGNHRLFALVILLRVDEQQRILSTPMRRRVLQHLKRTTDRLVATQSAEGYWDRNWEGSAWDAAWNSQPPLHRRILATGHAMEWWALAPAEVLPPPEVIARAGHWLTSSILEMTDSQVNVAYTFLSHAGRALCLWRGKFPYEVYVPPAPDASLR